MDERKTLIVALSLILVAGFLISLFPVRSGYHYWDETVYLQHAEILTGESPNNYNEFNFRPPLFSLILAGASLINSSTLSAHLAVAALSSLGVVLVYILGQELYSRRTAVLAAAIYAVSPLRIVLSHDILVDSVLPVFWLATAFCLVKAMRTDRPISYFSTGLAAALAVLMKFTSLVILPAIAALVVIKGLKGCSSPEELLNGLKTQVSSAGNWLLVAGFAAGFLPYLGWSQLTYGSALHVFITAWSKSGARDAFMTYLDGWNIYIIAPLYLGIPVFLRNINFKKLENYLPLVFFLALYIPLQFVITNKETRFMMPVLPFLALICAEGLRKLRSVEVSGDRKLSRSLFVFLLAVSLLLVPSSLPERNVFKQGFSAEWNAPVKEAGEWLKQNTDEETVVYTNYQYPALGYYSKREIVWFREYVPLDQIVGEEIDRPGYLYYSKNSTYPTPSLQELQNHPQFRLNESFQNTAYIFHFSGIGE